MVIVQQLDRILPARYQAAPRVHLGSQVEVDVVTFDTQLNESEPPHPSGVGGITTAWAPSKPTLAVETEFADADEYEVRVYDTESDQRLVAAIELISPANKDRPESRRQFVAKCASLLQQQVSVTLVDVVTTRMFNLYSELLQWMGVHDPALGDTPSNIYAVSCRWEPFGKHLWLETWSRPVAVGQILPELPLWLSDEFVIPLDLEASYEQTCRDLRIA
jgi:hypothetical protein